MLFICDIVLWNTSVAPVSNISNKGLQSVGIAELHYSSKKREHSLSILKSFFRPTEYETSDKDRKVNRNIQPDAGGSIRIWLCSSFHLSVFIRGFILWRVSDEKSFSVCLKNVPAFSSYSNIIINNFFYVG